MHAAVIRQDLKLPERAQLVADPLEYLLGTWVLERDIDDRRAGHVGRMLGLARVFRQGEHSAYGLEEGLLELPGYRDRVRRVTRYRQEHHGRLCMSFEDGRRLCDLDLRLGVCEVEHHCGADRYLGRFLIESGACWWVRWTVEGPAKQAVLTTRYRRATRG